MLDISSCCLVAIIASQPQLPMPNTIKDLELASILFAKDIFLLVEASDTVRF